MSSPTIPSVQPVPSVRRRRSRYYRMLPDIRYALALNVICALVITYILNPGSHLGQTLSTVKIDPWLFGAGVGYRF